MKGGLRRGHSSVINAWNLDTYSSPAPALCPIRTPAAEKWTQSCRMRRDSELHHLRGPRLEKI